MTMKSDSLYAVLLLTACILCTSCTTSRHSQPTTNDSFLREMNEDLHYKVDSVTHLAMTLNALRAQVEKLDEGKPVPSMTGELALHELRMMILEKEAQVREEILALEEILTNPPPGLPANLREAE